MKKTATVAFLLVALLLVAVVPSHAWSRHFHHVRPVGARVFVGVGPVWWGPPYPYWYYPPPYYYYYPPAPVVVTPAPIVVQESPVYVQQQVVPAPAPPAAAPESFWYYCPSSRAYYPNVQSCSEPWMKVAPR